MMVLNYILVFILKTVRTEEQQGGSAAATCNAWQANIKNPSLWLSVSSNYSCHIAILL